MKILHFGPVTESKSAGLSFSIPNLIKSQNYATKSEVAFLYNTENGVKARTLELAQYQIIVLHGYFFLSYFKVLIKMPRNVKLIICPRGSFSKSNKYDLKKHLYSLIYFSIIKIRGLNYSFHFLTKDEMRRSRYKTKNDFVIGNSIDISVSDVFYNELLKCKFKNKNIVYLGRFDNQMKGLDLLFSFILENKKTIEKNNIKFNFYGPSTQDKDRLIYFVKKHKIVNVEFHDEVYGDMKKRIFKKATFHILASRSEGFPMSVLESSSLYTPQLLSKGTNLQGAMILNRFGFPFNDQMLEKIIDLTFDEYKTIAVNARLFAEKHSYKAIGIKTKEFYKL